MRRFHVTLSFARPRAPSLPRCHACMFVLSALSVWPVITTTTSLSGFLKRSTLKSVERVVDETFHSLYEAPIARLSVRRSHLSFPPPLFPSLPLYLVANTHTGARGGQVRDRFCPLRMQSRRR